MQTNWCMVSALEIGFMGHDEHEINQCQLLHRGQNKMADVLQTTYPEGVYYWKDISDFSLKFH